MGASRIISHVFSKSLVFSSSRRWFSLNRLSLAPVPTMPHTPVMLSEVISYLDPQPGDVILDMTFGAGGHSEAILQSTPDLKVYGLDRDPVAYSIGEKLANKYPGQFFPMLGRFSELPQLLKSQDVSKVDGILIDAGCSSMQFDNPKRGFGISSDGPLDMRMEGYRYPDSPTAADVIEHMDEEHLAKILKVYGEEKQAKRIARALTEAKYMFKRLKTTSELASLVASVLDSELRMDKLGRTSHAATKTFQALRIFVNNELNELNRGIELAHEFLRPEGTFVTLTFHSLEDRIIKRHFVGIEMDEPVTKTLSQKYQNAAKYHKLEEVDSIFSKKWAVDNKHVHTPSPSEVEQNPRSRSAKLRCARKMGPV